MGLAGLTGLIGSTGLTGLAVGDSSCSTASALALSRRTHRRVDSDFPCRCSSHSKNSIRTRRSAQRLH